VPEPPVARSPIPVAGRATVQDGWEVAAATVAGQLLLVDVTPLTKVRLAGDPRTLVGESGVMDGSARLSKEGWLVTGLDAGERLVCGAAGTAATIMAAARSTGDEATVLVDVTHARAMFALEGRDATAILARLCPIDLASRPTGTALRTSVAGVVTDLATLDAAQPVLFLHCDRSYGHHLWSVLVEAGTDLGLAVAGSRTSLLRGDEDE
jgi:heterotetrameric sarcosine oxidase gamma subunit